MAVLSPNRKLSGVLAPLFSIRGGRDLGAGDTATLRELVDWAADLGLGFLQLLPVNETGDDHSPYNIISSMALEPSTISCHPDDLPGCDPALYATAAAGVGAAEMERVDYRAVKKRKRRLLENACRRFFSRDRKWAKARAEFDEFREIEEEWLSAYALHRTIMELYGGGEVSADWPEEHRGFTAATEWLESQQPVQLRKLHRRMRFWSWVQWVAHGQWARARAYAESRGVALMGDVPVGVSIYSTDVWAAPDLFDMDRCCGAPPEKVFKADPFTEKWGQNWGFPLYNWFAMSHDNFRWWRRRLQAMRRIFDLVRIDHALGFFRIYSFPWRPEENDSYLELNPEEVAARTGGRLPGFVERDDSTEENRARNRTHGMMLLGILQEEIEGHRIFAEDLGEVPPYVRPALAELGIPGFKIPHWEEAPEGGLVPGSEYPRLSITTFATHDHPPVKVWWDELVAAAVGRDEAAAAEARRVLAGVAGFCGRPGLPPAPFSLAMHRMLVGGLYASNAWLAACTINDFFGLDLRFNVPGSSGEGNWTARIGPPVAFWNGKWQPWVDTCRSLIVKNGRAR